MVPTERCTGLYRRRPRRLWIRDLCDRSQRRFEALPDEALLASLEDALYQERKRLETQHPKPGELETLAALHDALVRGRRPDWVRAGLGLVHGWAEEIHGVFQPRAYRLATRVMPRALNALLSRRPERLTEWRLESEPRIRVDGDLAFLRELCSEAVLVLAPTHVSNLDSPVIGMSLYLAGLPPFVYGAGLNLFSNPVVGFWMKRLGAYTVDRTKRATLYKDVLKDYSIQALVTGHHSLFFPGGTRSRSGAVEGRLKKGLLGTGVAAWQEMLQAGRPDPDVYVVPLTLSYQLVLEASTLVGDHLAEAGKQRYIIDDDESYRPVEVASFARRVLDLDSSVWCRYGAPLDVLGRPVPRDREERQEAARERRRYVANASGAVEEDAQRDRVYTDRLAESLLAAWPRHLTLLATNLAAFAAWSWLEETSGTTDVFRLLRVAAGRREMPRHLLLERLRPLLAQAQERRQTLRLDAPPTAEGVLDQALDRFGRFHRTPALVAAGSFVRMDDPKLCFYYRNRLTRAGLTTGAP